MAPVRFSVVNIGCKVNRVEVDAAAAQLLSQGAVLAGDAAADVVVVNTCTVTAEADRKTRKAVRQALRTNPGAQLLVTGCAAVMNPEWFEELDPRVKVVAKPDVAAKAWELCGGDVDGEYVAQPVEAEPVATAPAGNPTGALRAGEGFRTRVGIKAQDGCNNACTFCIVHVARGESRSVSFEAVVADARAHAQAGARELVLTGINLGAYDYGGRRLPDLLAALLDACPEARLRIGSIEPRDVDEALIQIMAGAEGRICRHLHLPLQSGASRVLREMNRPYDAAFFLGLVARLRATMPMISLSTDIIVGFPGESEADFSETLEVARAAGFSKIHVFRYSRRDGTPAAARTDQVPAEVSAQRAHRLQELGLQLRLGDARGRLGSVEQVLVERVGRGVTESYHPVQWDAARFPGMQRGQLAPVSLTEVSEDGIFLL